MDKKSKQKNTLENYNIPNSEDVTLYQLEYDMDIQNYYNQERSKNKLD